MMERGDDVISIEKEIIEREDDLRQSNHSLY